MDRPFSFLWDLQYNWSLEANTPLDLAAEKLEHIPRYWSSIIGKTLALYWYRNLAAETGLSTKDELVTVQPSQLIPASYHVYNGEFESVRKALEGTVALKKNSVKSEGYKTLFETERSCVDRLHQRIDTTPSEIYNIQLDDCKLPKKLYHRDVDQTLDDWRTITLECLTKHSAEYGDGNKQAFDECTQHYAEDLIKYGTNPELLNNWSRHFLGLFLAGAIKKVPVE